jgi:hypothetical protein
VYYDGRKAEFTYRSRTAASEIGLALRAIRDRARIAGFIVWVRTSDVGSHPMSLWYDVSLDWTEDDERCSGSCEQYCVGLIQQLRFSAIGGDWTFR